MASSNLSPDIAEDSINPPIQSPLTKKSNQLQQNIQTLESNLISDLEQHAKQSLEEADTALTKVIQQLSPLKDRIMQYEKQLRESIEKAEKEMEIAVAKAMKDIQGANSFEQLAEILAIDLKGSQQSNECQDDSSE